MKQIKRLVLVNAPLTFVILLRLLFLLKTKKSKSVHTSVFSCCSLYCPVGVWAWVGQSLTEIQPGIGAEPGLQDPKVCASLPAPPASSAYWVRSECSLAGRKEALSARWVPRADRKRSGWGDRDSSSACTYYGS